MKIERVLVSILLILYLPPVVSQVVPKVPERMIFAGDTILFSRMDIRERMDRELITFSYMHTSSTLMIKRANRLFPQIEPILKEYGVPDDLKYLMAIESNLDPTSLSAAGAAGLWQFMQTTARQYGLEVNANIDERYNTKKATQAACRYLLDAYAKYGNWMTVAASYNGGQNGISRRLEQQQQSSAIDLWLVEETSRYMFRILAAKLFFSSPSLFGYSFSSEDLYPYIPAKEQVVIDYQIDNLVEFAKTHGVSYAQLKRANLWLREASLNNKSRRVYVVDIPDVEAEYYNPSGVRAHCEDWIK